MCSEIMAKRDIFGELMGGVKNMAAHREGKITLPSNQLKPPKPPRESSKTKGTANPRTEIFNKLEQSLQDALAYEQGRKTRLRVSELASVRNSLTKAERKRQLREISAIRDSEIDTSDIPELTAEQMGRAVRGQGYRPVKRPVTMRLDVDVIEWLKQGGRGYQTKANRLLRTEMLRSVKNKSVQRDPESVRRRKLSRFEGV